ncbi:MAG: dTDP-glucose 4,6-dehydratase [Parcubacteria group bacterium Gr01-1014_38]|nr:MAG: dTDP-glucose 4,6-dehydratase [Parcubacteria group bacterium Gr01-1014_38]
MAERKTILVTGGSGFLGSHLCEVLLERGHDVICADNFFTGSKENIRHLLTHDHFELLRHDIVEPLYVECDEIYNLACPASPVHYQENPIKTIKTSTVGMVNMLGLAKRVGARILQASTSEVYGDPEVHPQPETYRGNVNVLSPRACYDEGKRVAEALCMDYHRQNGVDIRIARIFNTYGPRMDLNDGRVVSNFIVQALRGDPLTIYGQGTQTRSFCYVDDMIEGLIRLMEHPTFFGPVNVGNPEEIPVRILAEQILRLTRSRSRLTRKPLPADDPRQRCPDIRLAKTKLRWEPRVPLERGLKETIAWFKTQLREERAQPARRTKR